MKNLEIIPRSIIKKGNLRRVDIFAETEKSAHYTLEVFENESKILTKDFALSSGKSFASLWLALPDYDFNAEFKIFDKTGKELAQKSFKCKKPRHWTIYVMVSSHTDIGLHNSQYIQRYNSEKFTDMAKKLCDETQSRKDESRYRYMMEGSWFLSNYLSDRDKKSCDELINDYINKGKIGVCAGVAGNHTQTFGFEEMCRSTYSRAYLEEQGVKSKTMTMIDNNGLSWSMVGPYSNAGIENIIFAPNQWNPLPSTVFKRDCDVMSYTWNTEAGGGGSRIDVRYNSALPMLFYWQGKFKEKLLVWASTAYFNGGHNFGIEHDGIPIIETEERMAKQLTFMEEKYPYDLWFFACYTDDQEPALNLCDRLSEWNDTYDYPKLKMTGNPDEPFDKIREKYGNEIPVLKGDITGGWYQHPLSAAELLTEKQEADRRLANAEKIACIASLENSGYKYPYHDFGKAWAALIMNDEHSYGTSGYQGRRVYETWMQHRDWIEKARKTADKETENALKALSNKLKSDKDGLLVFNPTAFERTEKLSCNGECVASLPAFGYKIVDKNSFKKTDIIKTDCTEPPTIENEFYKIKFKGNGSLEEVFDKQAKRKLNSGSINEFIYTNDNHKSFYSPLKAEFSVEKGKYETTVKIKTSEEVSGAELIQTVTLPSFEKRIDFDNRLNHVRDMINTDRYKRYAYFAFPFDIKNCHRFCELGGSEAEYGIDITGHGTDVYMAAHEYCCADDISGDFGIGLIQLDSQLIEFDRIHPDKTDFNNLGNGSAVYSYLANDWLQMHVSGGSALNFRFRYTVTSYCSDHKKARLDKMAERTANPVLTMPIYKNPSGSLKETKNYLKSDARFLGLKPAKNSRGLIAHFFSEAVSSRISTELGSFLPSTIDERPTDCENSGFFAIRIGEDNIRIPIKEKEKTDELEIGGIETGLITEPCAACGEDYGMLYLLWGKCKSTKLSHYEVFRSETEEFSANESTFIAKVMPEEFTVGRYIDKGLKTNTRYYYRVAAVDKDGKRGPLSREFSALTKE